MSTRGMGLLGLFLMVPAAAFAGPLTLIVKSGATFSNVQGEFEFVSPQSKTGFVGALGLDVPLSSHLSLVPELGYAMRGFSLGESTIETFTGPGGTIESFQTADYLTISAPLSVAIPAGRLAFNLATGPQLAVKLSETFVTHGAIESNLKTDRLTSTDPGWLLGAGADVGFATGRLGVEGRYVLGTTNLNDGGPEDFKNRSFEVMATWKHPLGH